MMSQKGLLKGGEEKEDLNNQDSIEEQEKEGEMVEKKRCPRGTKKSKSGKSCIKKTRVPVRRTIKKRIVRARGSASIIRRRRR